MAYFKLATRFRNNRLPRSGMYWYKNYLKKLAYDALSPEEKYRKEKERKKRVDGIFMTMAYVQAYCESKTGFSYRSLM